jgi:hypothetical protein
MATSHTCRSPWALLPADNALWCLLDRGCQGVIDALIHFVRNRPPSPRSTDWPAENPTLKHAFDVCYYPCLDSTGGRPFGVYLHGNEGTEGAERGIDSITTGLGWTKAADTVVVSGRPGKDDLEACWNLGATVAAQLME